MSPSKHVRYSLTILTLPMFDTYRDKKEDLKGAKSEVDGIKVT